MAIPAAPVPAVRHAGPGAPLDAAVRTEMEPRFGHDFRNVRVHTDSDAARSADALDARAYATGDRIVFGAGEFAPQTSGGRRLLAHELAHVVQQAAAGAPTASASPQVSVPGDATERAADHAAEAATTGRSVGALSPAPAGAILRAARSNGGEFDTTKYVAINDGAGVGKKVGADIDLKFTPNDLVEADSIGLIQTVKTMRSNSAGGPVNDPSNARKVPNALATGEGDVGRGVDQLDYVPGSTLPQTNPLYAVGNKAGTVSTTLTDVPPDPSNGWGDHGHHRRKLDGTFEAAKDATLSDQPRRKVNFEGQEWQQSFEVAALALAGPMANTYLGSVAWGWQCDAKGNSSLSPTGVRLESPGAPGKAFMDASAKWNKMTVTDPSTGTKYDTVDIPTTTLAAGAMPAKDMSTSAIVIRIADIDAELVKLMPGPNVDRTNKEFERKALTAELALRTDKPTSSLAAEQAKASALPTKDLVARLDAATGEMLKTGMADALSILSGTPPAADSGKTDRQLELHALQAELKTRSVKVEVKVISTEDWLGGDEVYCKVSRDGAKPHRTPTQDVNDGGAATFMIPVSEMMPFTMGLKVEVFDEDSPDADDLIVTMPWSAPWAPLKNTASLDGANYDVKVEFER